MDLRQAARVHAALAHALVGLWEACPRAHQVVQGELDVWKGRSAGTDEEFFVQVARRLWQLGVEQAVIDALATAGAGEAHLYAMFDRVLVKTRAVYDAHANWTTEEVHLEIAVAQNQPYPDQAGFGELGTAACIPPCTESLPDEVTLTLVPGRLGPPSWASVPYLLCHELVCHAAQASAPDSTDPFTEGWMDMVARELHDRWVDLVFPWNPAFAKESGHRLSEVVRRRGPYLPEPYMTTRGARGTGWAAANRVLDLIKPLLEPDDEAAWSAFERLSIQLNRVSAVPAVHKSFVAAVHACHGDLARTTRLVVTLRHWMAGDIGAADVFSFT